MLEKILGFLEYSRNHPLKFLRENLSLIIIVPAVLGGIWQIIELTNISISYIRFFSISQIVPDGLIILMIIIYVAISVLLVFYLNKLIKEKFKFENDEENKRNITKNILFYFFITVMNLFFLYLVYHSLNKNNSFSQIFHSTLYYLTFIATQLFIAKFVKNRINLFDINIVDRLNKVFLIPLIFYLTLIFFKVNYEVFMKPKEIFNSINFNFYHKPNTASRILYFNDKYIFLQEFDLNTFEIKHKYNLTIKVIEFDRIFQEKRVDSVFSNEYKQRTIKAFSKIDSIEFNKIFRFSGTPKPRKEK